ncbi:MAG: cell wall-active antibiotics response protein, partial [Acidobacteriota bacterium]|nr:cell wall-active antibiotics response protein [Acidobacteriota bacterium]
SKLPLRGLEAHLGAGDMRLNVAGRYPKDVAVQVEGGAGEVQIRLPKDMGAVVDATVGIGNINSKGLTKRGGRYYNDAYAEGRPAVRMSVQGGVGNVTLSVE